MERKTLLSTAAVICIMPDPTRPLQTLFVNWSKPCSHPILGLTMGETQDSCQSLLNFWMCWMDDQRQCALLSFCYIPALANLWSPLPFCLVWSQTLVPHRSFEGTVTEFVLLHWCMWTKCKSSRLAGPLSKCETSSLLDVIEYPFSIFQCLLYSAISHFIVRREHGDLSSMWHR